MSLSPGSRLGVYEIVELIGRGGMGEVYRAHDTSLGRDVAIKVLPPYVNADDQSIIRFEREARALATLNHPNIAVIHGLEEVATGGADSARGKALVMELVDGETLAERLNRGRLTLDDAFRIASQIADALDAAHEKGIVHRDLKPANIKVRPDGTVKVLDFGLAKVLDEALPDSTTLAVATGPAAILGTPAYMAPEQAEGKTVDRRADIWAFGVVLYEMVTGTRLFRGTSVHETLVAVLTAEPDWARTPVSAKPLLEACLQRDLTKRLRAIGDYRFLLPGVARVGSSEPHAARRQRLQRLAIAGLALTAAGFFAGSRWVRQSPEPPATPVRLTTMMPAGVHVTRGPGFASSVAVSPDGRRLVVAATGRDGQRLYARNLDRVEATPLEGTERGWSPFFSWDGTWLGFYADGHLKRVPTGGGSPVDIAAVPGFPAGASWGPDDRILFSYGVDSPLQMVDAAGGSVEPLAGSPASARHPEVLPDARTVLFESAGWIHVLDRPTARTVRLVEGTAPRYIDGYVILGRGTTLLAAPFDVSRLELTGPLAPLVGDVAVELPGSAGGRHYGVSRNGTLVYVPAAARHALVVVSGDGTERPVASEQRTFENPRFSPDGRLIVVATTERDGQEADLWMHDFHSGTATRLTFDGGRAPVWTPDGNAVTYSHLGERRGIYVKRADGTGSSTQLLALSPFHWLVGWTPDRRILAYGLMDKSVSSVMSHADGQSSRVVGPGSTWGGRLSRDGRWLAYYVLDSGSFQVFVTPFPEGGPRHLIADGTDPAWAPDGSEIYYRSGSRLMAARIDKTAGVRVLSRRSVVEPFLPPLYDDYDIHPDGRTLVLVRPANSTLGREVTMVVNWIEEVRRLVSGS